MKFGITKNLTTKKVISTSLVSAITSLVALGFSSSGAMAIGLAITGVTTNTVNGANDASIPSTSTNPASFLNNSSSYPLVFGNDTSEILTISTSGATYSAAAAIPLNVFIRRNTAATATGTNNVNNTNSNIFYTPLTTPLTFNPPATVATGTTLELASQNALALTQEQILGQNNINLGSDNLFTNSGNVINNNNIERLDFISAATGFVATDALAFSIIERGSVGQNDRFKIAAITSLDVSGLPSGYGTIVTVNPGDYGGALATFQSAVFKDGSPSALNPSQSLAGLLIRPTTDLSISSGSTIFGFSIFANDVTATGADLVSFTNPAFFPTATGDGDGGLDLIAGNVGVVSVAVPFDFNPQLGVVILGGAWFVRRQLKKKASK